MALYRTGTAAMDAQGVITGTGTKWREPLSLIRTGATIVFLTSPLKLAVISDIVSDTEMKAIQTDGEPVENGNYVILLNDSLTVDGMAQDVAETLRYYQSKETVIEEAIEFFKNFDLKTLQDLVARAEVSAQKTDADRAATEQLKNDTQTIKDAAVTETQQIKDAAVSETQQIKNAAVAETNQIKADTDAIKNQTQQIKDSAVTEITGIKNEALDARDEAENAQFAAEQSKVGADNAKAGAETARDEARQLAQQVQPENLLHKDQNLNDLANKDLAREALKVEAVNSVKDQATGAYNSFRNPAWTYELRISNNGEWRVARNDDNSTSALSVGAGGTGASDVSGARRNLGLSSFESTSLDAYMRNPANLNQFIYMNNTGRWGAYDASTQQEIALGVAQGGTGAVNDVGARKNLNTPVGGQAIVIPNNSNVLGFMTTYAESGYYSCGELATYLPPEASGWWMFELHVHGRNASGHVEYGNIVATAMNGNKWGIICNAGSWGGWYRIARSDNRLMLLPPDVVSTFGDYSITMGDSDTGLRWSSDGVIQAVSNGQNIFAWTPSEIALYRTLNSWVVESGRFAYVQGVRRGDASAFISGIVEAGAHVDWRNRACGLAVEINTRGGAANIWKATRWGDQHACASDIVIYEDGSPFQRILVGGGEFGFAANGNATAASWISTSDIRLKVQLKEIKTAKEKVKSIKGYTYFKRNNLIEDEYSFYSEEAGVIAQDVQMVLPESVYKVSDDSEILGVNYNGVTALLVNAVNEMIDDSDKQNETIARQQEEINTLRNELDELKKLVKSMINGNASTIPELP
ncbi:tail fibers protein [Salmonella phage vB_SenS_UTK0007]|uniref:Tail fibers protein n=1 Tax=Salmonella phage vB_SenS_UTK0007 TaxID=3028905 RepID=A0AAE9ZNC8_9CAUD|nr:tail fibers protein [Salmonella phage vB_SenS_UTK0007]